MAIKVEQIEKVYAGKRTRKGAATKAQIKKSTSRKERRKGKKLLEDAPKKRQFEGYEY